MKPQLFFLWLLIGALTQCKKSKPPKDEPVPGTYAYDAEFLKKNSRNVLELKDESGQARVLLSADYQGRVMTSSANGPEGKSHGWINYALISSHEKKRQFNPVGGEERFWLGPEGGQYSIYFHAKDSFNLRHWQVPSIIDTVTYDLVSSTSADATFSKKAQLANYSGTLFDVQITRKISLLARADIEQQLGNNLPASVRAVAYRTENSVQNTGPEDWKKEKGLLSIWLLGMMTPSAATTVIIPFAPKSDAKSLITSDYFGEIPAERLQVKDSVLYFACDGKYRSKIGLSPLIAKPLALSYDFKNGILTIIFFAVSSDRPYVNSKWELQKEPFRGDVVNSYNDGPLADSSQLGPFYELESSSAALDLKKGETGTYRQVTCHLEGDFTSMNDLVKKLTGANLNEMKQVQ